MTSRHVFVAVVAAEYARKLKVERSRMHDEAEVLKQEIEALQQSIG